uniref:Uncharacterized protein n=1 Tax=Arundo donax TaxID=35708 RepID=A0A0A9HSM0_ARUDO
MLESSYNKSSFRNHVNSLLFMYHPRTIRLVKSGCIVLSCYSH